MPPLLPTVSDGQGSRTFLTLRCLATFSNALDSDCAHHPQKPALDAKHSARSGSKRCFRAAFGAAPSEKRHKKERIADVRDIDAKPSSKLAAAERLVQTEDVWSQILRFADKNTLSHCCLLNRRLYHLACPELWRHVTLGSLEFRYLHFVGELPQALLEHTYYLTLVLTDVGWLELSDTDSLKPEIPFNHARAANNCLHTFSLLIGRAKRIKSFSLRVMREDSPCADFVLRQQVLSDVVNALPATCTSIEIDTQGLDDGSMLVDDNVAARLVHSMANRDPQNCHGENVPVFEDEPWEKDTCLCSAVSKKLGQFHHIRLRLRSYCPQLLLATISHSNPVSSTELCGEFNKSPQKYTDLSYPNLKTLILNDVIQAHHWPSGRLMTRPIGNHGFASAKLRSPRELLHLSHSLGLFPNATTLRHLSFHPTGNVTVLENLIADSLEEVRIDWPGLVTLHQYRQSDLITGRTRILPTSRPYRPGKVPFVTKVITESFASENIGTPVHIKDCYDMRDSTESYLEGDIWATTTRGTGIPFVVLSELDHPVLQPQRLEAPSQNDWKKMHHVLRNERAIGRDLHEVEEISVLTPSGDDEGFDETPLEIMGWRLKPKTLHLAPTRVP